MKRKHLFIHTLTGLALMSPLAVFAQDTTQEASNQNQILMLLIMTMVVIALVTLLLTVTVFYLIKKQQATSTEAATESGTGSSHTTSPAKSEPDFWATMWEKINAFRPAEKERDLDLGHDYDGIRELDNSLPPWWKYGFYLSIVIAVAYFYVYHSPGSDWSSAQEYREAMAEAEVEKAEYLKIAGDQVDETSVELLADAASISNGQAIYTANCVACHGVEGQGGVGPNFADEYWIHGGDIKDLFNTIKYGVPEKGMISWQSQLGPRKMQEVASYILTFQGTTPPNPKQPEGELYVPDGEVPADSAITDSNSLALVISQ